MKQTIPLGRVAGIRIGAHWSVLVMIALIGWVLGSSVLPVTTPGGSVLAYWVVAVCGTVAFAAALLAHELAHSLVARHYGVPVRSITLWALGGVSELGGQPPTARADLLIAGAGPAASMAAGLVFGGLAEAALAAGAPDIAVAALGWLAVMNVLLAAFNLLPGAPLDGGRILRALLWLRYRDRTRAARSAATAGRVLGAVLIALGFAEILLWADAGGFWVALIGWFVLGAASAENATAALAGVRVGDIMTADPDIGATWMSVDYFIDWIAVNSNQSGFPVIGSGGALAGVAGARKLMRVAPARRACTTLEQVMAEVPADSVVAPDDPVAPLLGRPPLAGDLVAIVVRDGRVAGIVTLTRLRQVVRRETPRPRPGEPPGDGTDGRQGRGWSPVRASLSGLPGGVSSGQPLGGGRLGLGLADRGLCSLGDLTGDGRRVPGQRTAGRQ